VLQEGTTGTATGYASPMAPWWKAAWGRPTGSAFVSEGSTLQTFENGAALKKGSTVTFHDSRFIDVPPGMMFREEIEELAERGITTGWPDGTYRPLAEIQRDAMVAFVYRALGSPAFTPPSTSPFTDMSPSRMYYKEITWAHDQGIVNGWSDGTFRPTASIERGAVAAFLYRASGRPSSGTSNPFSDVPSTHQFAREITWLAATGITTGWPDGTFRPLAPIARDAMAAFMIRWMENRGL
jgi:S-layer homology domain